MKGGVDPDMILVVSMVVGSFALIVGAIFIGVKVGLDQQRKLLSVARSLGLSFEVAKGLKSGADYTTIYNEEDLGTDVVSKFAALASTWRITGIWKDHRLEIAPVTRSSGKNSTTYTTYRFWFEEPRAHGFKIKREGFWNKVGKAISSKTDIEIGDEDFDKRVLVEGPNPSSIQTWLRDPEVRQALLEFLSKWPYGYLDHQGMYFEYQGVKTKLEDYQTILEACGQWMYKLDS